VARLEPGELGRIYDRIYDHPGRKAHLEWTALRRIHMVLVSNQRELLALIDSVETNPTLGIEVMRNVGPGKTQEAFYDGTIRLLHNYLSALKTLVDHTRNLLRQYEGTSFAAQYKELVATTRGSGLVRFLQKLRDYLLHYQLPPIGTLGEVDNELGTFKVTVYLNRDVTLRFGDWPPEARTFLGAQPEFIPLRGLILGYAEEIDRLYRWLYPRFEELHGSQIREINALIAQAHGPVSPGRAL
jgi:hypothetical protein